MKIQDCDIRTQDLLVDGNKSTLFVVLYNQDIIASCMFFTPFTGSAYGQDFFVSESYRLNGVAKMLLYAVYDKMLEKGCSRIEGFCVEENLNFWDKVGWAVEYETEDGFQIYKIL